MNTISDRRVPFNLMVLFPGHSGRLAYDLDLIDTDLPFDVGAAIRNTANAGGRPRLFGEDTASG